MFGWIRRLFAGPDFPKPVDELLALQLLLCSGAMDGYSLRTRMQALGRPVDSPAFYRFMSALENKYVQGWYEKVTVGDYKAIRSMYKIVPPGEKRIEQLLEQHGVRAEKDLVFPPWTRNDTPA